MVFEVTLGLIYTIFGLSFSYAIMGILLMIGWNDIKKKILYYTHYTTHGWFYWMKPNGMIDSKVMPLGDALLVKLKGGKGKKKVARIFATKHSREYTNSSGGNFFYSENKNPIKIHSILDEGKPEFMDDAKESAQINMLSYNQGYIDGGSGDKIGKAVLGTNLVVLLAVIIVGIYVLVNGVPA